MSIENEVTPKATIIKESKEVASFRSAIKSWVAGGIGYKELMNNYPQSLLTPPERAIKFLRSLRHKPTSK